MYSKKTKGHLDIAFGSLYYIYDGANFHSQILDLVIVFVVEIVHT